MPVTKAGEEMPNTPNITMARSSREPRRSAATTPSRMPATSTITVLIRLRKK